MDPASILGLTTTAFGVVDRLAKTLNFLINLSTKLKYANAQIALLIGYLGSLNAAISEIADIVKGLSGRIEYQKLAQSLDTALECTKFSLSFLEMKLESLSDSDDQRTLLDKVTFILRGAEFEEYINGVSRYINALNLLLSALQSRSILEQRGILDNSEADGIMISMEDETSSLFCLGDSQSVISKRTENSETSSALDVTFEFDTEILSSKIYAVAYRSHLRQAIASRKRLDTLELQEEAEDNGLEDDSSSTVTAIPVPDENESQDRTSTAESQNSAPQAADSTVDQSAVQPKTSEKLNQPSTKIARLAANGKAETISRSRARSLLDLLPLRNRRAEAAKYKAAKAISDEIDEKLRAERAEREGRGSEAKVLILGSGGSGKSTLLRAMKLFYEGTWTFEERTSFNEIVFNNLVQGVRVVLEAMEHFEIPLGSIENEYHVQTIFMQPFRIETDYLPVEVPVAIRELAYDEGFQSALRRRKEYQLSDCFDYYLENVDRIGELDYAASDRDIILSRTKTTGITETTFNSGKEVDGRSITLKVFDVGGVRSERKKWIHCFHETDVILFMVDIGCYDQLLSEDETVSRMQEAFTLWDSICNSRWFIRTEFILIFTRQAKLAAKLESSPLKNYFPSYDVGEPADVGLATEYLIDRFTSLNQHETKKIRVIVMPDLPTNEDWKNMEQCYADAVSARWQRLIW